MQINGRLIFKWAKDLFPFHRSITGKGTEIPYRISSVDEAKAIQLNADDK